MKTVKEVSLISGVSIRTLHHYHAIGLLPPTYVTEAGYRLYDDNALRRLQTILLLRSLEFPLKEIREILDAPDFEPMAAIGDQIRLLELRRDQLNRLIDHARQIQQTGVIPLDFKPYDTAELDAYAAEAKQRWGKTDAYREFEQKTRGQSREAQKADGEALMEIFAKFGAIRTGSPNSAQAHALVKKLQAFITDHYYTCTTQILSGLGQMYIAGDAMTENIDRAGGEGTARFVHAAIEHYCK